MLSNVIGTSFSRTVLSQLYMRAAKNSTATRDDNQVLFLANKSAWVKMVSSVDIALEDVSAQQAQQANNTLKILGLPQFVKGSTDLSSYYQDFGIEDTSLYSDGTSLAKRWVLEAGTSVASGSGINLRYGVGGEGSYGLANKYTLANGTATEYLGPNPMPGLTSVQVDVAGRLGSLKIATVNFKVWNMNQLNIMEALYFRLGYSMLLEWGHTQYYTNEGVFVTSNGSTQIYGIDDPFRPNLRKERIQQEITLKREKPQVDCNYDGMLGVVSNFTWAFNQEGGYDCTVKLIGLGSIIDTMRINQAYVLPNGLIKNFKTATQAIQDAKDRAAAEKARLDAIAAAAAATANLGKNAGAPVSSLTTITDYTSLLANAKTDAYTGTDTEFFNLTHVWSKDYFYQSTAGDAEVSVNGLPPTNPTYFGLFINRSNDPANPKFTGRLQNTVGAEFSFAGNRIQTLARAAVDKGTVSANGKEFSTDNAGTTTYGGESLDLSLRAGTSSGRKTYIGAVWDLATSVFSPQAATSDIEIDYNTKLLYPFNVKMTYLSSDGKKHQITITYQKPSDENYAPTREQIIQAIDNYVSPTSNWKLTLSAKMERSKINDPSITFSLSSNDFITGQTAAITVKNVKYTGPAVTGANQPAATKDTTVNFTISSDTSEFVNTIGPAPTAPTSTAPSTSTGATGATGKTNTADTDQTNQAYESALTAMLAYVKTTTQALALNGLQVDNFKENNGSLKNKTNLLESTKIFYSQGILKGVSFDNPAPFVSADVEEPFDLTKYAQKGFNTSMMANPKLYGYVPPVNYYELCKAYLVRYQQGAPGSTQDLASARVYIKLGYLLAFLNNMCLIYDTTPTAKSLSTAPSEDPSNVRPYVYIDFNPETNFCLTAPEQMSIDPTICLIPFQGTKTDYQTVFAPAMWNAIKSKAFDPSGKDNQLSGNLPPFKAKDNSNVGRMMDILLDVDYLLNLSNSFATSDPEHSVNLKRFLDALLVDVNKCLGNFNVFRAAYIDEANTVQIRDDQFTPDVLKQGSILERQYYLLQSNRYSSKLSDVVQKAAYTQADISSLQYGQLPIFGLQSIARGFEFKTNMSTKLGAMIAISAQASVGSVNAKDPSSLGYLNQNYQDRYKPRIIDPIPTTATTTKGSANNDEVVANAFNDHVKSIYGTFNTFDSNRIEMAKNYYIERSSKVKTSSQNTVSAPFIPADLEITIDGIGGIIMGQAFTIPEDRLPKSLRGDDGFTKVGFIVTGLTHTIENNQWLTKIKGQMIKLRENSNYGAAEIIKKLQIATTTVATLSNTTTTSGGTPVAGCKGRGNEYKSTKGYQDPELRAGAERLAQRYGLTSAEPLYQVMNAECGLNAADGLWQDNASRADRSLPIKYLNHAAPGYTLVAAGLIQFTSPNVGHEVPSLEAVLAMSAKEQLAPGGPVEKYFDPAKSFLRGGGALQVYTIVFFPVMQSHLNDDNWVIKYGRLSAEAVSKANPALARAAGKTPGEPLTTADFKKYIACITSP